MAFFLNKKARTKERTAFSRFKTVFFIILVCLLFISHLWYRRLQTATIEVAGTHTELYVARTTEQRVKGLGGRDSLGDTDGMIFLFDESDQYAIVMRDMEFPIDIVWVDQGTVVDIAQNVAPEPDTDEGDLRRYFPRLPANVVLEFPAGWVESHNLSIGDQVTVVDD